MTRVTLELDERTLAGLDAVARARQTSVEDLLRRHAENIARLAPIEISNASHRQILSALEADRYDSAKARKAKASAEIYLANRQRILQLIDETRADMGSQAWDRRCVYEYRVAFLVSNEH